MQRFLTAALLVCGCFVSPASAGGDPDLNLYLEDTAGVSGTVDVDLTFDNTLGLVAAWSVAVCHTAEVDIDSVALGSTSATVFAGAAPDFETTNLWPGEGWSSGLVIDFFSTVHLEIGTGYELYTASYMILGSPGQVADLTFCGPELPLPTETVIAMQGGVSTVPTTSPGSIEILDESFYFSFADMSVSYDLVTGDASFSACATVREDAGNAGYPNDALAFSMSVEHDSALLTATDVSATGVIAALDGGAGPDFFGTNLLAGSSTIGCIFAYAMDSPIQFTSDMEVACFDYDTTGSLAGDSVGTTTSLDFEATGDPAVANVVVVGLSEVPAVGNSGSIDLTTGGFRRGDGNGDGGVDIADPVWNLAYLFQAGPSNCLSSQDDNDDGAVDIADPVYSLTFLFQAGPVIPAPYPNCGSDPTPDAITCDNAFGCP